MPAIGEPAPDGALSNTSRDALTTSVERLGATVVLKVGGEIDLLTVAALNAAIAKALAEEGALLIVDLSAVDFLATAGLQTLVATHEAVGESTRFAVVANSPVAVRPIQLTGLDQLFPLFASMNDALAALDSGAC
jgi:anti-sigma B factor antagonist